MEPFEILSEPRKIYKRMLEDINSAKKAIYLETYIYGDDKVGREFRRALIEKARQGVKIKILIDSWGSPDIDLKFFSEIINLGGEVKLFRHFVLTARLFTKNHERNHRKLLIVDDKIGYIGSANICNSDWRELVVRLIGKIVGHFSTSFNAHWNISGKLTKKKFGSIIHRGFEIIQDIPGDLEQLTTSKYLKLIKNAKEEILIETPYFVPPFRIRRALRKAVKRGVDVKILLPNKSDVGLVDFLRNRYLGNLYRRGIKIYYYTPKILHSKLIVVDKKYFILGSSNLDYRSFIYQFEINLFGRDKKMASALREFFYSGIKKSRQFSYEDWKNRSSFSKIIEFILHPIQRYF